MKGQNPFHNFNNQRGGSSMEDLVNQFFGQRHHHQQRPLKKGRGLNIPLKIELDDVFFGRNKKIKYKREVNCNTCHATGGDHHICRQCRGRGTVQHAVGNAFFRQLHQVECSACNGRGKIIIRPCKTCGGHERVNRENTIDFSIPKDLMTGQIYTFRNLGDEIKDGETGDLQIQVVIINHPNFKVHNHDLIYEPKISVLDMILGCKLEVPHFEGPIMAHVPEGSDVEKKFILRGKGLKSSSGPGNVIISPKVVMPGRLTDADKKALKMISDKEKS